MHRRNDDHGIGAISDAADHIGSVAFQRITQALGIQRMDGFVHGLAARGTSTVLTALHAKGRLQIDDPVRNLVADSRSDLLQADRADLCLGASGSRTGGMDVIRAAVVVNGVITGVQIPVSSLLDGIPLLLSAGVGDVN